jgi:hypothetical protein
MFLQALWLFVASCATPYSLRKNLIVKSLGILILQYFVHYFYASGHAKSIFFAPAEVVTSLQQRRRRPAFSAPITISHLFCRF